MCCIRYRKKHNIACVGTGKPIQYCREFRAYLRRINPLGALIVSMCGISLVTILALLPRMSNVSGNFWLATLWLTWLASLWALTRPSFSIIFTALMLSMFIFIIVPATGAQLYGGSVLATHNYQAGVTQR